MVFDKKQYQREYYQKNKEYRKRPQFIKTKRIGNWKTQGLIGDYEAIYQRYLNTTNCDLCNIQLCEGRKGSNRKCMDHNHQNGQFRNIVCNTCNQNKRDNKIRTDNKSGYKNISFDKRDKVWVYRKQFKGKDIYISSKDKIKILCIKFAGILLYKY